MLQTAESRASGGSHQLGRVTQELAEQQAESDKKLAQLQAEVGSLGAVAPSELPMFSEIFLIGNLIRRIASACWRLG